MTQQLKIISGKDYFSDNYVISAGRFATDLVAVSSVVISSDPTSHMYSVGFPSNEFQLKWNVEPTASAYITYKAPKYACQSVTLNTFYEDLSSETYTVLASSVTGTGYWISNDIEWDTGVIGSGNNTENPLISGVHQCLIIPQASHGDYFTVSSKTFLYSTLSGGIESVRVTVTRPPTALVTVALSSFTEIVSSTFLIDYYEVSGKIIKQENVVDSWYVDVSGFMFPDQYPASNWPLGWVVEGNETESIESHYIDKVSNNIGDTYTYVPTTVNEITNTQCIDYVRFKFSEPGIKKITFVVCNTAVNATGVNVSDSFARYGLSSMFFNSNSSLRISRVSADYINEPESVTLSAISFFDSGSQEIPLDSTFPNISWKFDTSLISANSIKDNNTIVSGTYYSPVLKDCIKFSTSTAGRYPITVCTPSVTSVYIWQNFTPVDINLLYNYDNCSPTRKLEISAVTTFNGENVLFYGDDKYGNPLNIKWSWGGDNINAQSNTGSVYNNVIHQSTYANPITAFFNNPESLTRVLCSTMFTVSTDVITTVYPFPSASFVVNYDLMPKGFEIDFDINFETASLLNGTFYRITMDDMYSIKYAGKIKPDESTGWLDSADFELLPEAETKVYYYPNGDKTKAVYGVNHTQTFNFLVSNMHLSSITFEVSCLSASPNFGYGHTKSKTIKLNLYKDSFIPELSAILYPEYDWLLPSTTPSVCSLYLNPNTYWVNTPPPSAYGEGRTNLFLGSAFDTTNKYDSFNWYPQGGNKQSSKLLVFSVPSEMGKTSTTQVNVGGFISTYDLFNTSLSTFKNDIDGSIEVFKNWKTIQKPISTVLYDSATAIDISYTKTIVDSNNVYFNFNIDAKYPNYSPVKLDLSNTNMYWTIIADTGEDFSGFSIAGEPYSILLNAEETSIKTLYVKVSAYAAEHIPNTDTYSFDYGYKYKNIEVPLNTSTASSFDVSIINFTLSSLKHGAISDNNTNQISAWTDLTLSGVPISVLPISSFEWIVNGSSLGTSTAFITSLPRQGGVPSSLVSKTVPITLKIQSGIFTFEKTKELVIDPPIYDLNWRLFADNTMVKLSSDCIFYNDTTGPIPISSIQYKFEDESETSQRILFGDLYIKNFNSGVGTKSVFLTANDFMGFSYNTKLNNVVTVISAWNEYNEDRITNNITNIKHSFDEIKIKPNEFVLSDCINNSFEKIYENLLFFENISKFYSKPPFQLLGWYGYSNNTVKWNLFHFDENYSHITDIDKIENLVSYSVLNTEYVLLAYKNKLEVRANKYESSLIDSKNERSINDNFIEIKNALCDSGGRIIVLDAYNFGTITAYEYNSALTDSFKYIYKWGGLGSADSKIGFKNANDMTIDSNDNLWIADTGNRVVKEFTSTGGWIKTLNSPLFNPSNTSEDGTVSNGSVISVSNGSNEVTYALTNELVVVFKDGVEHTNFKWTTAENLELTPVKIVASTDDNIVYIICEQRILKFTKDGYYIGILGQHPQEYTTDIQNIKYVNLSHFNSKVLHIVSSNFVVKYADFISYLSVKPNLAEYWWKLENLKIESEEFVDYWVYNKIFSRLFDNLEYFRSSLQSRVLFSLNTSGKLVYNLYRRTEEYKPLFSYSKDQILIGVNEIVTSDVINRCLLRIQQCSLELLDMITSQKSSYKWINTISVGVNPLTWEETKKINQKPTRWGGAVS